MRLRRLRETVSLGLALIGPTLRAMLHAPRTWRARGWLGAAAFVLALGVVLAGRTPLQAWIPPATTDEPIAWTANAFGGGVAVGVFGLALAVLGAVLDRRAWRDAAAVLFAGAAPCFVLTKIGQFVLAEDRPNEGGAMHFFVAFGHGVSGHSSATAFLFFPLVRVLARDASPRARTAFAIALGAWVALVAWTRMSLGMHYAWNVLLGLGLGFYVGHAATRAWSASDRSPPRTREPRSSPEHTREATARRLLFPPRWPNADAPWVRCS